LKAKWRVTRAETAAAAILFSWTSGCAAAGPAAPGVATPPRPVATEVEPLKAANPSRALLIGAAVQAGYLRSEPVYAAAFAHHFDYVTAEYEMKWGQLERQRGLSDYSRADEIVAFAEARGIRIKGHALLWHSDSPAWFEDLSPQEAWRAVEDHVRRTVGRYRGRVAAWDVVNEAIADDGSGLRDSVYLRKLGPGYIAEVFRLAHEADPHALLVYNEYGAEGMGRKSDDVYNLVRSLILEGVPIGGVGLQMHLEDSRQPPTADIARN
jgi:endo-1,4-beta-xylanase